MLLDAVNTPFSDQGYARRQMLSFVQKQYKPGEKMAIFTLTASAGRLVTNQRCFGNSQRWFDCGCP